MRKFRGILLAWFLVLNSVHSLSPQALRANDRPVSLKYPVVLVHGIVAHDRGRIVSFWGRIPEVLRQNGITVFFGNTDAWGNYESNAEILATTIESVLQETNSEKVNIIAHSKGGIDSRYLIWKYDFGDKVASLTTISTPHRGSEIADLIYRQGIIHSDVAKRAMKVFGELYGDLNPNLYNVNYQLTTAKMREFNEIVERDDRVYYQSMYTTMNSSFDDLMFFYSHWYIKNAVGDNDGIVSAYSASWGDNVTKINGGISHAEILDIKGRKISGIYIPDIYLNIARDLADRGF
jgi:triacylglycerol lipase